MDKIALARRLGRWVFDGDGDAKAELIKAAKAWPFMHRLRLKQLAQEIIERVG